MLPGCVALKSSLLPSGCVQVDIEVGTGKVVGHGFVAFTPTQIANAVNELTDLTCPLAPSDPVGVPMLEATLPEGTIVRAWRGRASLHLLHGAPLADVSALVRDLPGSALDAPNVAPVLEIVPTGLSADATKAVALDVTVCRASAQALAASGCLCPSVAWPDPTQPGPAPWLRLTLPGADRLLTPAVHNALGRRTGTARGLGPAKK